MEGQTDKLERRGVIRSNKKRGLCNLNPVFYVYFTLSLLKKYDDKNFLPLPTPSKYLPFLQK